MSLINHRPGLGNAAAYQVSGWPFVTGSIISASVPYVKVTLPSVSKSITVFNRDANDIWPYNQTGSTTLLLYFGKDVTGSYPGPQTLYNHVISIPPSGSVTLDVKCSQFFVAKKNAAMFGAFQALAELTNIDTIDMYQAGLEANSRNRDSILTGSGIDSAI